MTTTVTLVARVEEDVSVRVQIWEGHMLEQWHLRNGQRVEIQASDGMEFRLSEIRDSDRNIETTKFAI